MRSLGLLLALICVLTTTRVVWAQPDPDAMKLFTDMVQAHRKFPAVTIKATLTIEVEQGGQRAEGKEVPAEFIYDVSGDGIFKVGGFTLWINDDDIFATHESNEDEYFALRDQQYLQNAIIYSCFGAFDRAPFPHLAMFWGVDKMDELIMEFYIDTPELVPAEVKDRLLDGKAVRTLVLRGPEGSLEVNMDPETYVVHSMKQEITGGALVPVGVTRTNTYGFEYELRESQFEPAELKFDPGDRQRIDVMASLVKQPDIATQDGEAWQPAEQPSLVGKPAPGFLLQTTDGKMVDLDNLKGSVVVIDFWATWCPPCREALPKLHEVAEWAEANNLPVVVLTINTFENGRNVEDKTKIVTEFWNKAGHTLPVLMDSENQTAEAYGVTGIPATFVIAPDGRVAGEHSGFSPDYVQRLRAAVKEAIKM